MDKDDKVLVGSCWPGQREFWPGKPPQLDFDPKTMRSLDLIRARIGTHSKKHEKLKNPNTQRTCKSLEEAE